ncbi:MAG: cation:proton antiporter, partial [Proteobacteria bacterium]|nr:cation:proton antiporter [Pseudomonadota bacterium]
MMPVFNDVFTEIAVLLLIAAIIGGIAVRLRQPLIVAFIAVGILVGPSVLGWVSANDQVDLLAKLGIALLLFVVGLKLDLHIIRTMGPVALATGLGQVVFTSVVGYFIAIALGMTSVTALYVAVALTFSSTIIIVKLLSDKREVDALHGRIAIGFLIIQDIVVVLVMIGLTALGEAGDTDSLGQEAITVLIKGGLFIAAVGLLMRFVLTPLLQQLAKSPELLVLFAIAWAVALGAAGAHLGFSKEVGAFIAGVSLASTPYREAIGSRLVSLRDFLLLFFFIDLGAGLELATLGAQVVPAIFLSLFVLIGNPLIVMIILGFMGYRKRTGFLAGLTVAQISEFSLILGALGLSLGHINADTMGLITLVGLITISASTYLILYSHPIYEWISPWLGLFERKRAFREETGDVTTEESNVDIIVFGLGRFGSGIARELQQRGLRVLGVDFDPDLVHKQDGNGYKVHYGDAEDPEFVASLPLGQTPVILSSVRELSINLALLHGL